MSYIAMGITRDTYNWTWSIAHQEQLANEYRNDEAVGNRPLNDGVQRTKGW